MEPNSIGRKLGIGLRVAGRIARDRAQEAGERSRQQPATAPSLPPKQISEFAQRGRRVGQGIGQGSRQFGRSIFRPVAHASGVLWLEVTGCFFAIFAAFFAQNVYRVRSQFAFGPDHRRFVLYAILTLIFIYFSASSFLRARRQSKKQREG